MENEVYERDYGTLLSEPDPAQRTMLKRMGAFLHDIDMQQPREAGMNAQEIKDILIAYLKATDCEIRIYQEKSIGGAVCDLMTVTSCLTGYEIKSDLDNYQRLNHQIIAYDRFFEKCYIVVGGRHLKSADQKVPGHWGIITIQSDHVTVNRPARAGNPACDSQLRVLWKLELSNLLTKAGLPLYTYKSKEYIIGQIVEKLDQAEIRKHVAYELMHRDYTLFNAKDYSLHFNAAQMKRFENRIFSDSIFS